MENLDFLNFQPELKAKVNSGFVFRINKDFLKNFKSDELEVAPVGFYKI